MEEIASGRNVCPLQLTRSKMITTIDNYDLSARNTFAMNVKCGIFMEYTKADDIPFLLSSIRKDIGKMPSVPGATSYSLMIIPEWYCTVP